MSQNNIDRFHKTVLTNHHALVINYCVVILKFQKDYFLVIFASQSFISLALNLGKLKLFNVLILFFLSEQLFIEYV